MTLALSATGWRKTEDLPGQHGTPTKRDGRVENLVPRLKQTEEKQTSFAVTPSRTLPGEVAGLPTDPSRALRTPLQPNAGQGVAPQHKNESATDSEPPQTSERHSTSSGIFEHGDTEPVRAHRRRSHVERTGVLRINSRPWAEVYVDGEHIGSTPQMNVVLEAGMHRVRLVSPAFNLEESFDVRVVGGKAITRIVTLRPQDETGAELP